MEAIFETNPVFLSSLLGDLKIGKIQLPDFQRGWVWEDERIRGVLASISRSFPIGALMMLETGGETRFQPRPVEGVELAKHVDPELLVLDGQQRLTSLFQATTYGKVVATQNVRKQQIKRWFYFDMQRALASAEDREAAIVGVPENRIRSALLRADLPRQRRLPVRRAFDEVLRDAGVRARIEKQGTMADLVEAEHMWPSLWGDPQREQIKHFRDKATAHLAQTDSMITRLSCAEFFNFPHRTALVLEKLAHASGGTRERLQEHFDDFAAAAEIFGPHGKSGEATTSPR